jgi:hypothetical protein
VIVACGLGPCGLRLRGLRHDFGGSHDDDDLDIVGAGFRSGLRGW